MPQLNLKIDSQSYDEPSPVNEITLIKKRLNIIFYIFCACFLLLGIKLCLVGYTSYQEAKVLKKNTRPYSPKVRRADIIDRNGKTLATNLKVNSLYADPMRVRDAEGLASDLLAIFPDINFELILKRLSNPKRRFAWIKREISPEQYNLVMGLGEPALAFKEETKRVYINANSTSHILGMVDIDDKGISGVERYFDEILAQSSGDPLRLSIDVNIQALVHNVLTKTVDKFLAKGACGIVLDVYTGEVVSLVNLPDFNPNIKGSIEGGNNFNLCTHGTLELGSVFKPFTVAYALESGVVSIGDKIDAIDKLKIGRFKISDYHAKKEVLTIPETLAHSSNIATARLALEMGEVKLKEALRKFNLIYKLDELELPEKAIPKVPNRFGKTYTATISYGHGVATSPMNLVSAFASLVNGGIYKSASMLYGGNKSALESRVISEKVSSMMKAMLRLTTLHGTGKKAKTDGYMMGGKTGTAEKPDTKAKGYAKKKLLSSFVGAFPMDEPMYVVMVVVDEPQGIKESFNYATAGWTAAPAVAEIVNKAAPILNIPPRANILEKDAEIISVIPASVREIRFK